MLPYQNYQRIEVSTAEPLRIIVLLYEGAIKNLNQTVRLFKSDAMAASAKLNRTLDIINYLRNALDHEQGGAIAGNLERLYDYMRDTLAAANISKDTAKVEEVITLLQTLLEGWRGISSGTTTEVADPFAAASVPPASMKSVSFVG